MNTTPAATKPKSWLITILTILIVGAVAYFILSKRASIHQAIHPTVQQQVAGITSALEANRASVGQPQIIADLEGAEQVVALDINGKTIRLVELDISKPKSAEEIAHIRQHRATKTLAAAQSAEVEGAIVILDFDKHPDQAKILEAFHKASTGGK
ncbi:MAG: hypothetical protein K8T91_16035 [Planctomycetes bacterium]|nr:hypothetical protein [Planctomycetota bacterium]